MSLVWVAVLVLLHILGSPAHSPDDTEVPDVIVVGDIHGDFYHNLATLHSTGVIDDSGHWKMGRRTLVQVGDILDRGDDCRYILDHYEQLAEEAAAMGGQVIRLLGNHEIMNLGNDLRYVTAGDYSLFGGFKNRALAFGANGDYGKKLRQLPLTTALNDTVIVHAGLVPNWAKKGVTEINRLGAEAIAANKWQASVFSSNGPIWTRELIYEAQRGSCTGVTSALKALSSTEGRPMRRMVVGHTPIKGRIHFFCDGALVDIDIAMARGMRGGYAGALAIFFNGDEPSNAIMVPPKQKFNKKVVKAMTQQLSSTFHAQYVADGKYPPNVDDDLGEL